MNKQLTVEIHSYWHAGTGRTSGSHVDSLVEKNNSGLPLLNGKHIKGLLRDAVARAADWGWFDEQVQGLPVSAKALEAWLFGTRNASDNSDDSSRFDTTAGVVFVSNAELPEADRLILSQKESSELKTGLFRHVFSTAIDEETGTAKDHSLRGAEVVIPLTLHSEITFNGDEKAAPAVFEILTQSLSLIDHVGGMRNRGFGRATLSLDEAATQGGHAA